jgi:hypothetical protein
MKLNKRIIILLVTAALAGMASDVKADVFSDEVKMTAETLSPSNPMDHGRYMARVAIIDAQKQGRLNVARVQWALRQDSYQFGHPDAWYEVAYQTFSAVIKRWKQKGEMPQ